MKVKNALCEAKTGKIISIYDKHIAETTVKMALWNERADKLIGVYDDLIELKTGLIVVKEDNKYGVYNKDGKIVAPITKDEILINDGIELGSNCLISFYLILVDGNTMTAMNGDGEFITKRKYQRISAFTFGVSEVQDLNGKWGIIDICGNEILPCEYDYIFIFSSKEVFTRKNGYKSAVESTIDISDKIQLQ